MTASEETWKNGGEVLRIQAHYPNVTVDPYVTYAASYIEALAVCVALAISGKHTTIEAITPHGMPLIKLWGYEIPEVIKWELSHV